MINGRHRQLADDLVNRLKTSNSVDEYELRQLGGEIYDVMRWLKEYEIISQTEVGRPFVKGKYFAQYTNLDNLLNPPKDKWDGWYKKAAIFSSIIVPILTGVTVYQQVQANKREKELEATLKSLDSLTLKVQNLDKLIMDKEKQISDIYSKIDSLTEQLKVKK